MSSVWGPRRVLHNDAVLHKRGDVTKNKIISCSDLDLCKCRLNNGETLVIVFTLFYSYTKLFELLSCESTC